MEASVNPDLRRELSPRQWDVARLKLPARDLREAIDLSILVSGKSVEELADALGLESKWTLYKQLADLRVPLHSLIPFMAACGSRIILKWLASGCDYLLLPRPRGRKVRPGEAAAVVSDVTKRLGRALELAREPKHKDKALLELDAAMTSIAGLRGALEKARQPELF